MARCSIIVHEVPDSPEGVLSRCEEAVHDQVTGETWLRACQLARERERYWLDDGGGCQASEAFVAREVCRELTAELRRLEPAPTEHDVGTYLDTTALAPLEPRPLASGSPLSRARPPMSSALSVVAA